MISEILFLIPLQLYWRIFKLYLFVSSRGGGRLGCVGGVWGLGVIGGVGVAAGGLWVGIRGLDGSDC